ncbi:MAG: regulatory protein RecX [Methylacidiphilales bacterium]|nr:regulatory protein RecX [Candidatus Methylacidiphilales bacterium]
MTFRKQVQNKNTSRRTCFDYAQALLSKQMYTSVTLSRKLTHRGYPDGEVSQVIEKCTSLNFLNDTQYSMMYVQSRIRKGFGPKKIYGELLQRGISKQIAVDHINQIHWHDVLDTMAQTRSVFAKMIQNASTNYTHRAKLYRYIISRGFGKSDFEYVTSSSSLS